MVTQVKFFGLVLAVTLGLVASVYGSEASQQESTPGATQLGGVGTGSHAAKAHSSNGTKTVDAVVVRPITFISSVFSAGAFILALPFAALDPAMDVQKTRETMVDYPFGYTFQRPLGDFSGAAW
jgi:hypothetical protein